MKLSATLFTTNMQATLDFYIPLGFEARDIIQEGDEIKSMRLIYKDNDDICFDFILNEKQKAVSGNVIFVIEESPEDIPAHQKKRYGAPKEMEVMDPNGYRLIFKSA